VRRQRNCYARWSDLRRRRRCVRNDSEQQICVLGQLARCRMLQRRGVQRTSDDMLMQRMQSARRPWSARWLVRTLKLVVFRRR
jgi:hypothetical protein